MTHAVWTSGGTPVDATHFSREEWDSMKAAWHPGAYVLPCCKAPAVLKTSINGVQFFAHLTDECATAPETVWHREGKAAVLAALHSMAVPGREEVSGRSPAGDKWAADVLIELPGRTIAVELQRSPQTMAKFLQRQERYRASNVECYWLLRREVYLPLAKSTSRLVLKRDFGNKWPEAGIGTGMLPELPVAVLVPEAPRPVQFGLGAASSVSEWLQALISGEFRHRGGAWNIRKRSDAGP
ncbi:hypothetical protein CDL60_14300 [Roseateles noduli]|nr:hypothetical protein CDL60_14300 [Roseateles noduli]